MLSIGIVGLPNVGKSTLFNALTHSKQANAQNYPFCTIEPNVGIVEVPDVRLQKLAEIEKSQKVVPTAIQFIDIAGIVKGASVGEGLGNKFLSHIRECDAIAQVVRGFVNDDIIHVHNKVDPKDDAVVINLELIFADLQTVTKRLENAHKKARGVIPKEVAKEIEVLDRVKAALEAEKPARSLEYTEEDMVVMKELCLLTMKPMMYVVNVDEQAIVGKQNLVIEEGVPHVYICAQTEAELSDLSAEDATEYMQSLGMEQSGLDKIILAGYRLLDLITFLTAGEQETRAWTVKSGAKAPEAAGVIHTDFIKGFIKADVVSFPDFVELGGWSGVKGTAKIRLEGKDYVVKDGDVVYFHIGN
jgi:GTP-binding protein YchF